MPPDGEFVVAILCLVYFTLIYVYFEDLGVKSRFINMINGGRVILVILVMSVMLGHEKN